jgi:predicted MFS family arabinose efflux permease
MKLSRKSWLQLISSTLIRTVTNTGFRMVFPFQPLLMKGFGISLPTITRLYAGQSLIGVLSPFLASVADTRGRRTGMLTGLVLFSLGTGLILFWPTPLGFFLFLVLSMLGKSVFDPSLQAYFGDTIPYIRRGFALGILEISWSLSFFVGMPLIGFTLNQFGLLAPFLILAILGILSILVIMYLLPPDEVTVSSNASIIKNIAGVLSTQSALAGLIVMLMICLANQLVVVVFGVWLNYSFGMQAAALGGASAVIGLAELIGEGGVSAIADRVIKTRAVLLGLISNVLASLLLPALGGSVWGAYLGLFFFFLTFEFTIVSLIPVMTGVLPSYRGTVMALTIASVNLGRGLGSLVAAPLYLRGFWVITFIAALVTLLAIFVLRYVVVQEES